MVAAFALACLAVMTVHIACSGKRWSCCASAGSAGRAGLYFTIPFIEQTALKAAGASW
ncbi:MAG: hypothetical protein ACLSVD_08485 [Eggerthellaceae bacterium]